jgi:glycosyltransferase involved in cell wall biosynthesis
MKISVCYTTFKRTDLLFESVKPFLNDDRVSEIVISDDSSPMHIYAELQGFFTGIDKVRLYRNDKNQDCYFNKRTAVLHATNEYVLILDSDNIFDVSYLDTIYAQHWSPERILQPSFAKPHFDFRKYNSLLAHRKNVARYAKDSTFTTMLNAFNFFVNRDRYLQVWDGSVDPVTSDSIYFNYKWLEAGNSIYVTPGLEYEHRIHDLSHYKNNVSRTPAGFHESILKKLKALR